MSDTTEILRDARVRAYLTEVRRHVAAVDPAAADGIMREIADHIRDAAGEPGFDLEAVLSDLGDPAVIAAAVQPGPESTPPKPGFADSDAGVIVALLLLTVGTYTLHVLGWLLAMLLLWTSRRWNTTDRIVGMLVWPTVILIAVPLQGSLSISHLFTLITAIAPIPVAIWLLIRAYRRPRPVPEPRTAAEPGRTGGWAWLDRWPAGVTVILAPVLVLAALTLFAITGNPRALLTGGTGAIAIVGGTLVVLWWSRGWTQSDKVRGTATLVLFVLSLVVAPLAAPPNAGSAMCAGTECVPPAGFEAQPLTLLLQLMVPLMLLHAVHLGIRFRAAGTTGRIVIGRGESWGVVGLVALGGTAFACFVGARFGAAILLVPAGIALALWAVGVILLWRADGWTGIDRVVGSFALPVLVVFPLYAPLAIAANGSPLVLGPAVVEQGWSVAWGVFIVVELLVAGWLLIRFEPRARD